MQNDTLSMKSLDHRILYPLAMGSYLSCLSIAYETVPRVFQNYATEQFLFTLIITCGIAVVLVAIGERIELAHFAQSKGGRALAFGLLTPLVLIPLNTVLLITFSTSLHVSSEVMRLAFSWSIFLGLAILGIAWVQQYNSSNRVDILTAIPCAVIISIVQLQMIDLLDSTFVGIAILFVTITCACLIPISTSNQKTCYKYQLHETKRSGAVFPLIALIGFSYQVVSGIATGDKFEVPFNVTYLSVCILALVILLLLLRISQNLSAKMPKALSRSSVITLISSAVMLIMVALVNDLGLFGSNIFLGRVGYSRTIAIVGITCFQALILLMALKVSRLGFKKRDSTKRFLLVMLAYFAGRALGVLVLLGGQDQWIPSVGLEILAISTLMLAALLVFLLLLLNGLKIDALVRYFNHHHHDLKVDGLPDGIELTAHGEQDFDVERVKESLVTTVEVNPLVTAFELISKDSDLSEREYEIMALLVSGLSRKSISAMVFLSPSTVATHISHAYKKFNVGSQGEFFDLLHSRSGSHESDETHS